MKVCVAFLRGINVGGKNSLPMKDLLNVLQKLGARDIKTYIQSGNAVFGWENQDTAKLSNQIRAEIKKRHGFDPHVLLLELRDLERIIRQNPFPEADADSASVHVGFLDSAPSRPDLKALASLQSKSERFRLIDSVFYLYAPDGVGRSKLAARAERLIGVPMTLRNWRTVNKVWDMARGISEG